MADEQTTESLDTINQWQRETFPLATIDGVLRHIEEEWQEFQRAATVADRVEEAADLIILLSCYIDQVTGLGAQSSVDGKMRRNRTRRWNIKPDGTGRHASDSNQTTDETAQLQCDFVRERWVGEIQVFLEQMMKAAPDETCRIFAEGLWRETAEFTDD
jgi:hypothetical protein